MSCQWDDGLDRGMYATFYFGNSKEGKLEGEEARRADCDYRAERREEIYNPYPAEPTTT